MSREYPCVYYDNQKCRKFSDDDTDSWCVMGPCSHETPSHADRIRVMSDEELAEFRSGEHCPPGMRFPDCATIKPCKECWLEYLKQPVKDGEGDGRT